jgi:hypothetical protein
MDTNEPAKVPGFFRVTLNLDFAEDRMDHVLFTALQAQDENAKLKNISKRALKSLFDDKKIFIKGQRAKSSSRVNKGVTYVDIEGF